MPTFGRNVDSSAIGGEEGAVTAGTLAHSFLQIRALHDVWPGYLTIRDLFAH